MGRGGNPRERWRRERGWLVGKEGRTGYDDMLAAAANRGLLSPAG